MKIFLKKLIPLCLAASISIGVAGCSFTSEKSSQEEKDNEPSVSEQLPLNKPAASINDFTMSYNDEVSVNPYTCADDNNYLISQLLYEGLFVLNDSFQAENVLCESYETEDGIEFDFNVIEDVKFSDGSDLKAIDVAYSINEARTSERFAKSLSEIESCTESDDYTVHITLSGKNYQLPKLLDVPIVAYETGDYNVPVGTGAYVLQGDNGNYSLAPRSDYHGKKAEKTITLTSLTTSYADAFSSGALDLTVDDVYGPDDITFSGNFEMHYYNTTVLQYVGFNMNSFFMSEQSIRSGIAELIDQSAIVSEIMDNKATASPLIFSPAWSGYDSKWERSKANGIELLSKAMHDLGLSDTDNDGILEMPSQDEESGREFSIDFIVNSENRYKVDAAKKIASNLTRLGIEVNVKALKWDDFKSALNSGNFDMYYGEVYLPADFDMSMLLSSGGTHNYGGVYNSDYTDLIDEYLGAKDEQAQQKAAKDICDLVQQNVPIVPILYRQYAAIIQRNKVSGASPTQSNIFYGFDNWKIK